MLHSKERFPGDRKTTTTVFVQHHYSPRRPSDLTGNRNIPSPQGPHSHTLLRWPSSSSERGPPRGPPPYGPLCTSRGDVFRFIQYGAFFSDWYVAGILFHCRTCKVSGLGDGSIFPYNTGESLLWEKKMKEAVIICWLPRERGTVWGTSYCLWIKFTAQKLAYHFFWKS